MHIDQQPYRQLHDALLSYEGGAAYDDLLRPWLAGQEGERRWLDALRARTGRPVPPMSTEELWRLYALSRVLDLLQLSFSPSTGEGGWNAARIAPDEHARFLAQLGLEPIGGSAFHPFHHEVVAVDQDEDDDAPPRLVEVFWPGCRLGPLLVARAGCRVRAGRRHLAREIAERSTLYWAYARSHRPTADLGLGWGGNSQWRTAFRRDYALDGMLCYNVDAHAVRGGDGAEELSQAERGELVRHRCRVTSTRPDGDLWPYGFTLVESA